MAVPSYTTDLATIDLADAETAWAEPTASGWTTGGSPAQDGDNPFQGTYAISKAYSAIGVGGMMANKGSALTLPTDGAILGWFCWAAPGALESDANGGIRIMVGTDLANFKSWDLGGKTSYVYGGWINYAVNTTVLADDTVGTGLGNSQYSGAAVWSTRDIARGNPFFCDAFRFGRCELRINGGQAADYATFAGYAAKNDANDATNGYNKWGLFQAIAGGYLFKGLMILGYGSPVDFRDSNKNILIQNTNKVTANFNTFEVRQATSHIDWTGISIAALGTVSKGRFVTTDNATITFDTCTFTDMNTFLFMSGAEIKATTFRRCGQVTQGGAVFNGCKFDKSTASIALVVANAIASVTNTEFISSGTGYALEGFTVSDTEANFNLTNLTFTDYSANGTTNAAIHVLAGAGKTVHLVRTGGTAPTYKSEGATVDFPSSRTLKMVIKNAAGGVMSGVSVYINDQDDPEYILNTATDVNGEASVLYTGADAINAIWRARKYGYIPFQQLVSIGSDPITLPVTMVVDTIVPPP